MGGVGGDFEVMLSSEVQLHNQLMPLDLLDLLEIADLQWPMCRIKYL